MATSINLASKYASMIDAKFTKNSFTNGNASTDYDFSGVKSITIYTPETVDLNDYVRSGQNRYGTPVEMGDSIQELQLSQDKSFSITIDRGNNLDQMNTKGGAKMLNMQIKERVIPAMDKYTIGRWSYLAGTVEGLSAAPTKSTIVEAIFNGAKALDNLLVPDDNRILYLPTTYYNMLRLSDQWVAVDNLAEKALSRGYVGMVADMKVIKIPDSYMPANAYFLITYKGSVLAPNKIKKAKLTADPPGIDGDLLEGRNYYDAFVLSAKAGGVYLAAASANVVAAPVVAISSHSATITAVTGVTFKYTTDGSDPRYSKTAQTYSSAVTTTAGTVFKAFGEKSGSFPSAVSTQVDA